ncbi:MAG: TlyA family RNA methyltransferase [Pseudomonadota bacterium]
MRLDQFLVERGDFPSRARAQAAIRAGCVLINGAPAIKPSATAPKNANIRVEGDAHPYVSRGGVKLAAALDVFEIDPSGKICLDLGASTGGFSDVLLRRNAKRVFAVDVGVDQLHASLSADPRVVNLERTHAKDLSPALITDPIDLLVADVSFISLKKAAPNVLGLCAPSAHAVLLVKPQFEAGRQAIGKGGIVSLTPAQTRAIAEDIGRWLERDIGQWKVTDLAESPIAGGDGNREYLLAASRGL